LFALSLFDAKLHSRAAALKNLKTTKGAKQKAAAIEQAFEMWVERCASAIREWWPKYVDLAQTFFSEIEGDIVTWVEGRVCYGIEGGCGLSPALNQLSHSRVSETVVLWFAHACGGSPKSHLEIAGWLAPRWLAPNKKEQLEFMRDHSRRLAWRCFSVIDDEKLRSRLAIAINRPQTADASLRGLSAVQGAPPGDERASVPGERRQLPSSTGRKAGYCPLDGHSENAEGAMAKPPDRPRAQEFPKMVYHSAYQLNGTSYKIVQNSAEQRALGPEWFERPEYASAAFDSRPKPQQLEILSRSTNPTVAIDRYYGRLFESALGKEKLQIAQEFRDEHPHLAVNSEWARPYLPHLPAAVTPAMSGDKPKEPGPKRVTSKAPPPITPLRGTHTWRPDDSRLKEQDFARWAKGQTSDGLRDELRRLELQRTELERERPELADKGASHVLQDSPRPLERLYAKVGHCIEDVKAELIGRGERLRPDQSLAPASIGKGGPQEEGKAVAKFAHAPRVVRLETLERLLPKYTSELAPDSRERLPIAKALANGGRGTDHKTVLKTRRRDDRKGELKLLQGKDRVTFRVAEQYLGITERQRQNLVKSGALTVEGRGHNRKVTTKSLREYLPPENPN
jgi:hypothetical protein